MAFLGVDQSLNATGLCRLDAAGDLLTSATVTTDDRKDGTRLLFIRTAVDTMLTGVSFVAMEGYSYGSTGRVFELGEVGGVIKALLAERGIPYVVVPPVLVKKFATGNAFARKEDMLLAAQARGCAFVDDNQADAFFLAHIARAFFANTARHRRELEVVHTLRTSLTTKKTRPRKVRRLVKNAV
jgi:Holliday junction resolvasome RuvABC endonuclease subunit